MTYIQSHYGPHEEPWRVELLLDREAKIPLAHEVIQLLMCLQVCISLRLASCVEICVRTYRARVQGPFTRYIPSIGHFDYKLVRHSIPKARRPDGLGDGGLGELGPQSMTSEH